MILLSAAQASDILAAFEQADSAEVSLDLGKSRSTVSRRDDGVQLAPGVWISLDILGKIARTPDDVFSVEDGQAQKVIRFSEATGRTYKLRPTADWPALEISGILMHRIAGTTPMRDAQAKLQLIAPARGAVLETCAGLGYTAILAAATARAVTVIEKDPNVLEMARLNPHSSGLFENPRITLVHADASEAVTAMPDASFDAVDHDPPTLSVAGELYSDAFYGHLLRILRPGGVLLHYTGAPGSRGRRVDLNASVSRRLARVGFAKVRTDGATACILASKGRGRA